MSTVRHICFLIIQVLKLIVIRVESICFQVSSAWCIGLILGPALGGFLAQVILVLVISCEEMHLETLFVVVVKHPELDMCMPTLQDGRVLEEYVKRSK